VVRVVDNVAQSGPLSSHPFHCSGMLRMSSSVLTLGLYPGVGRVMLRVDNSRFGEKRR